jgi:HK97 gp10 family phage protein
MTVTADFSEVDQLAVDLAAAGTAVNVASETIVSEEADRIRNDAAQRSPVLTGALRAGWYVTDGGDGTKIVTNDTRQAFYQEFGTTRHGPQPSLFPAADQGEERIATKLETVAGTIL